MQYLYMASEIEEQIEAWLFSASMHEITVVMGCLGNGINSRLLRLAADKQWLSRLSKGRFEHALYLDLRALELGEFEIERDLLAQIKQNTEAKTILIINGLEELIHGQNVFISELIQAHRSKKCGMLLVTNKNMLNGQWASTLTDNISFAPSFFYFGMWSKQLAVLAVQELAKDWQAIIPPEIIERIAVLSGGYVIIAKRLAWHYACGNHQEIETLELEPDTIWILSRLIRNFDDKELYLMLDIVNGETVGEQRLFMELAYLKALRIVSMTQPYKLLVPCLVEYLRRYQADTRIQNTTGDQLVVDGVVIGDQIPTKQKQILQLLVDRAGEIVSRETLIAEVWGNDYEITDWAVDGQISRLRRSIVVLGIDKSRIVTKKGKGYLWQA